MDTQNSVGQWGRDCLRFAPDSKAVVTTRHESEASDPELIERFGVGSLGEHLRNRPRSGKTMLTTASRVDLGMLRGRRLMTRETTARTAHVRLLTLTR